MKTRRSSPVLPLFLAGFLCACSGVETDPTYRDRTREDLYRYGSVASEDGGFSLLGEKEEKKQEGLGVNAFLWRATLDTISFLPIASADPLGGLITTDWRVSPDAPNERIKLNVLILDRDLRADGVRVSVFRQTRDEKGDWIDAPVAATTASSLEEAILTRARQLRLAQREKK